LLALSLSPMAFSGGITYSSKRLLARYVMSYGPLTYQLIYIYIYIYIRSRQPDNKGMLFKSIRRIIQSDQKGRNGCHHHIPRRLILVRTWIW
jgi:hypothetical protein